MEKIPIFKDEPYQIGTRTVRMNSIEHLRAQNITKHLSRSGVIKKLGEYSDERNGIAERAMQRLQTQELSGHDYELVAAMIYLGQQYGLGASPQYPEIADLLWHAAAFILEDHKVSHPNELRQS